MGLCETLLVLLLALGAWTCERMGKLRNGMASVPVQALCGPVRARGFQMPQAGWVLAAGYRMLDCILIVSPLEEEDE